MRNPSSIKREFFKKWLLALRKCTSLKNMGILERKKAIKISADIAMASTRNGNTFWSRALIANIASKHGTNINSVLIDHMLGSKFERLKKKPVGSSKKRVLHKRSKRILKRSCGIRKIARKSRRTSCCDIAKSLVKKRTRVLKSLVPGGEFMDDGRLIEETLDYIVCLRAQVDVMLSLVNATERVSESY